MSTFHILKEKLQQSISKNVKTDDHAGVNLQAFGDASVCAELSSLASLAARTGKVLLGNADVGQVVPTLSSSPVSESGVVTSLSWSPRISQTACGNS